MPDIFGNFNNAPLGKNGKNGKRIEEITSIDDQEGHGEASPVGEEFSRNKKIACYILSLLVFVFLGSRLFYLQVVKGDYYKNAAEGNRIRTEVVRAPRGLILDSKGNVLAQNMPNFEITTVPIDLPKKQEERDKILDELSKLINLPAQEMKAKIEKDGWYSNAPVILKEKVPYEEAIVVETKLAGLAGIKLEKNPIRNYVAGENFSHTLGYIGKVDKEDVEGNREYQLTDWIGKTGLETQYEDELRGIHGKRLVEVDSTGKVINSLFPQAEIAPESGHNLVLGIDAGLQNATASALKEFANQYGSEKAAAIAMDPRTGEIRALVSLPNYDNNAFASGIDQNVYAQLINDKNKPLLNRAIGGTYPTGSTIKPVMATAGLSEGTINQSTSIADNGLISVPNQYDPSIVYNFPDWKPGGHGSVDVKKAIAESCDIFFYAVGGGYKHITGLGIKKMGEWFNKFGLGAKLGIDLPGEKEGLVPSPEWKKEVKGETWGLGDTYHASIGQGDVLATPLQVVEYTSIVANGGTLYKPHIVSKITDGNGNVVREIKPEAVRQVADPAVLKIVQEGMRQTVTAGTARTLNNLPFTVAGKTGTSQFGLDNKNTHAWFVAYAPYENPEIAVVVLVEGGGEGHSTAVPVARKMLEYYFANK